MADVITRFKLETTQFDSKLRDTAKGLREISHQASLGGKDFDNFSKKAIESARALGTVQSGATNTKDKLRDLVGSYNDAAKAYNELTDKAKQGEFGKAMSQSLQQLQQEIKRTKEDLYSIGDATKGGGGGIGSKFTDMLSVAGGTLVAQGAMKLADELKATVQQGLELARAGEGIRAAFDKLNNPGLLANLREATHGTVSDIELMKAAVQFNDFKLPIEELGTMLEFAQKKAKDTGQSVDYMVSSIVTGLGRKSVMILDNLGLSAAQIKEKMKDGGDMTKAVGEIIREEMAKAGDYVETAADRAARAAAQTKNEMEELGRAAMPVAEEFDKAWNTIKIGGMQLINKVLVPMANSLKWIQETLGSTSTELFEKAWSKAGGEVGSNVDDKGNYIRRPAQKGATGFDWDKGTWKPGYTGAIYNSATGQTELPEVTVQGHTPTKTTSTGGGGGGGNRQQINITFNADKAALAGEHGTDTMPSVWGMLDEKGRKQVIDTGAKAFDLGKDITEKDLKKLLGKDKKEDKKDEKVMDSMTKLTSGVTSIFSGIEQMGVELPDGMKQALNAINGLMSIAQSILIVVEAIKGLEAVGLFKLAGGGIVPHAAGGYMIGGNSYSGDNIYAGGAWVNSGELVLNRAQQSTLASQLQGQDKQMHVVGEVQGEKIILVANRTFRRKGQGEIVTW